jgi:hypothetical protein
MPGLKTIIALSFVLAVGFLLVILSCALFKVYLPLVVVATYVLAPLPNWICGRCANPDDFVESTGNAVLDLGRFATGFLVVMGIGESLFIVFEYSGVLSRLGGVPFAAAHNPSSPALHLHGLLSSDGICGSRRIAEDQEEMLPIMIRDYY